jgi:hypothetical protein
MAFDRRFARVLMAGSFWFGIFSFCSPQARAQQLSILASASYVDGDSVAASSQLPDAPDSHVSQQQQTSSAQPPSTESGEGKQTKRILGIVPNFRSVSVNSRLPAQTVEEKFTGFTQDSFDYSSFIFVGLLSGVSQIQGSTPEFHTGAPAYGRYYWHTFADQTDENLWVGFLLPVALRQDPRYFTLGGGTTEKHNGLVKRAGYAFSRILITRTDSGGNNFNFSEVVGAGAASGVSCFYYPSSNRTWTKTGQRWALNVGIDGATFIFKEFWPDINHAIFHSK